MSEIKAGDVVQLKSGSYPMTVEEVTQTATDSKVAHCIWRNSDGYNLLKMQISVEALVKKQ